MRTITKVAIGLVLAVTCSVGVAACGSDEETSTAAAVTKTSFVKKGDVVLCTKTKAVAAAAASIDQQAPSRQELKDLVLRGVLPAVQTAHDDLASLERPAADGQQITAFLTELQRTIDATRANPAQLVTGPDPFAKADKLILAYGLHDCAV